MGERKLLFYRKTRMPTPLGQTDKRTDAALDPRTLFEHLRVMKRARRHALRAWGATLLIFYGF